MEIFDINVMLKLDNLDIVIPCTHHPIQPSSSSSKKVLEARLIFDEYQDLVYYHANGKRLVSTRNSQSDPLIFNPFCHDCNDAVFNAVLKQKLKHLRYNMWDEAIVKNVSSDDDSKKFKEVYEYKVVCFVLDEQVCDEEEFRAWISDGNKGFKVEDVPIIQGLERVNNDDNDDDDDCGICLQSLKTLNIEEDQDSDEGRHDTITTTTGGGGGGGGDDDSGGGGDGVGVIPKSFLAMLPCKHVFHEPCVIPWLLKDRICPLCRYKLPRSHLLMSD